MNKFLMLLSGLMLAACATKTEFKERVEPTDMGYKFEKIAGDDSFDITVRVDKEVEPKYAEMYEMRAAGEVCAKHGFDYFDPSNSFTEAAIKDLETKKLFVTCFKTKERQGMNVVFVGNKNINESTPELKIEELPAGVDTPLKVGDVVTSFNRIKVKNAYDIKKAVRTVAVKKAKTVEVEFTRGDKELHAKVPLLSSDTNLGPDDLKLLRAYLN